MSSNDATDLLMFQGPVWSKYQFFAVSGHVV